MKRFQTIIVLSVFAVFTSCSTVLFQEPQPVGVKNESKVPKALQGVWITDGDTVSIDKRGYHSMARYESEDYIPPSDTLRSYFVKGDRVYINEAGSLIHGKLIWQRGDSISYMRREVKDIVLGRNNILRQVGNHYILNQYDTDVKWWTISLLSANKNGDVVMFGIADKDTTFISDPYKLYSNGSNIYTDVQWSENQMIDLINNGLFRDTLLILPGANRIK